jgi:hypothetical protein
MRSKKQAAHILAVRTATGKAWDEMSPVARHNAKANFDLMMGFRELSRNLTWNFSDLYDVSSVIEETGTDEAKVLVEETWNIEAGLDELAGRINDVEDEAAQTLRREFGIELLDHHDYNFALIYELLTYQEDDDFLANGVAA